MELQEHFLLKKAFFEHHQFYEKGIVVSEEVLKELPQSIQFKGNPKDEFCCFKIDGNREPYTSYFIGTDWLNGSKDKAVYIQPKLNKRKTA